MAEKHTFQSIILKLQEYWAEKGCVIWQPYYTQVGAGTMNPATFLRVLGPDAWNVAYVEPSVRPDDGRYGENPNRLQMHYQFQVILKPDPGNPQELYLDSLKAIGINPREHDIRFVEDNWEQPAISAWGLGWEVWLDGQEITQFTYFQQVGGIALDPVAVEITYGLDRILIALNGAPSIWGEPWSDSLKYGDIRRREEFEHSKYYYEVAGVEHARQMYELFAQECLACLDAGLVLPAHDYVLKCSHTFNIMDARGAVGVTERQAYFRRMREMAKKVAEAYLAQQMDQVRSGKGNLLTDTSGIDKKAERRTPLTYTTNQTFVFEIGVEELPAEDVDSAASQLKDKMSKLFDSSLLEYDTVRIFATPRRISALVTGLQTRQADKREVVKGPPADKAFDQDGNPTPAAIGFAKKNGVEASELSIENIDNGNYVVANVFKSGLSTEAVLADALPKLIGEIKFERSMKWNSSGIAFSRPIRWILALFGANVIEFSYANVSSGSFTHGLRPYGSPILQITKADDYEEQLRNHGIVLEKDQRKAVIRQLVEDSVKKVNGRVTIDEALLDEVTNLVEKPAAILGQFDSEFLNLPRDVLVSTMKKHQRYFPVEKLEPDSGVLLPYFIAIRNGDEEHLDIVTHGNEHVLGARFADANYFVREDLKHPLEYYRNGLEKLTFHTKLGSMLAKSDRIVRLAPKVAEILELSPEKIKLVERAAFLSKADLTTQMVTEMTSLQGLVGREYASRSGEAVDVCTAIGEQYKTVPASEIGITIALADRIDSLVGLIGAGVVPSGAKDPFGLRRTAIGIVQPLLELGYHVDLSALIHLSAQDQPLDVKLEQERATLDFITGRLKAALLEMGYRYDAVEAVLERAFTDPALSLAYVRQLVAENAKLDWEETLDAYARCVRIIRSATFDENEIKPELLQEPTEKELFETIALINPTALGDISGLFLTLRSLTPKITAFFDHVLVMVDDGAIKANRLNLLKKIADLALPFCDLSKMEGF
ncbi:MAG TPA: glycine--tRNA ligase subunit beta [Anaerolineales bacterium]|nr:glycine--tRNA ligase subunit beta [Anaerolineales bacterium]